jgi:hypothetical protein
MNHAKWKTFLIWAVLGSTGLFVFYVFVSSLVSRSFIHSLEQFALLQPWITILVVSFGAQVGLFKLVKSGHYMTGASGGVGGSAMVLCCAHHVGEILPVLGASGLGLVLTAYQKDFLVLGVIINILALAYLLRILFFRNSKVIKYSFGIVAGGFFLVGTFLLGRDIYLREISVTEGAQIKSQIRTVGEIEIEVVPKSITPGKEMVFTLTLDNHIIDLDYDLVQMTVAVDQSGRIYTPVDWTGGRGGHHLTGDLVFAELSQEARQIGLNIRSINNQNVLFDWEI